MMWLLIIPVLPYFILLLDIYRNLRKAIPYDFQKIPKTRVSVIIPCRNEEKNVPLLLDDLYKQDYNDKLFEVIVIDDNSFDNTYNIVSAYRQIRNLKVLKNPAEGKKSAIGAGINEASGELIITTDADCRPGEKWISSIAAFYTDNQPDMIIAPVRLENIPGFSGGFRELEFLSLQGVTAGTAIAGNPVLCNGANLAFTKEAYNRHSENLHTEVASGDDIFLLHSLKKEPNSKIVWLSSIDGAVTTSHTDSLSAFISQRARWISKARAYTDRYTIIISIVTFVTILTTVFLLVATAFNQKFLLVLLASVILKSIPDFFILYAITGLYSKRPLMRWFIPSQIVYPFYVITVVFRSLIRRIRWK
jgi:biofilm PGA synthesis N-glycosyltransferase PgaC